MLSLMFTMLFAIINPYPVESDSLFKTSKDHDLLVSREAQTGLTVCIRNLTFLFLNQNICCGYSNEPSP